MISKVEQLLSAGNLESLFGMFLVSRKNEGEQGEAGFWIWGSRVFLLELSKKGLQSGTTSFSFSFGFCEGQVSASL